MTGIVTDRTAAKAREALPVLRRRLAECEQLDKHGPLACQFRRAVAQCESLIEVNEGGAA